MLCKWYLILIGYCMHALTLPCTYRRVSLVEEAIAEETTWEEGEGQMIIGKTKEFVSQFILMPTLRNSTSSYKLVS